ncbi:hypothetical protein [Paraburkholderia sp. BR14264]|uniref:hypothetical protein n=1 Tax=unclassified Paraburkholderia TaxID=2615204 RepID=UPI00397DE7AC
MNGLLLNGSTQANPRLGFRNQFACKLRRRPAKRQAPLTAPQLANMKGAVPDDLRLGGDVEQVAVLEVCEYQARARVDQQIANRVEKLVARESRAWSA